MIRSSKAGAAECLKLKMMHTNFIRAFPPPPRLFCLTFDSAKRNRQKAGVGTGKELMGSLPSFFFFFGAVVVDGGSFMHFVLPYSPFPSFLLLLFFKVVVAAYIYIYLAETELPSLVFLASFLSLSLSHSVGGNFTCKTFLTNSAGLLFFFSSPSGFALFSCS